MNAPLNDAALFSTRIKIDGTSHHVAIFSAGMTLGLRPGKGRLVAWSEIAAVADGPPADRFGVVINDRLALIFDDEAEAHDRAADQRQLGAAATVIRVPVPLAT